MNPSSEDSPAEVPAALPADRGPVVALLVATALLLLPLLYGWYRFSADTLGCLGRPAGCRGQRAPVMSAVDWGLLLVAGPVAGAALLGVGGAILRRRAAVWAAAGAFLGTLLMWVVAVHALGEGLQHSNIDF
ncbi:MULTISPECIES: hypothetical protein [Streptomyces]|uniref:hypothetical protein n=1 Tax=Streptomyces TaxID=1883 RepID=UPI0004CD7122|nr:hypothetical protein [Streptomyces durhamensis]